MDTYLITGASSDVAIAYIKKLRDVAKEQVRIIAHYNSSKDKLMDAANGSSNIELIPVQADLTCEADVSALIEAVKNCGETPKYFLHFPATKFEYMRYKEMDTAKVQKELQVGLMSYLSISRELYPSMKNIEGARAIVMLTNYVAEDMPPKFMLHYIVAKYALLGAMKAGAAEFGGKKLMINGVSPSMMDTKFLENLDPHIIELNRSTGKLGNVLGVIPVIDKLLSKDCELNGYNYVLSEEDLA